MTLTFDLENYFSI